MHGPIDRVHDIARTAEALLARKEYLAFCVRRDTPKRWKVLHCANASDMSDGAFRQLFTFMAYARANLTGSSPSHKTVSLVTGRCERTSKNATKELQDDGWIETKRTRREEAVRKITIPQCILDAIPDAAIDTKCRSEKSCTSKNQEVQKRASRSAKSDTSTILEVQKTPLRSAEFCPQTIYNQGCLVDKERAQAFGSAKKELSTDDLHSLRHKMFEAAGEALAEMASIEPISEALGWLNSGCDIELDILPVIRKLSQKKIAEGQPRTITLWKYFRKAVLEARDARITQHPPPKSVNGHAPKLTRAQRAEAIIQKVYAGRPEGSTQ